MVNTASSELAEIEVALAKSYRVAPFRLLLFIFWGLILAKCCIVEWAILNYNTPINGFVYVWIPSIVFGGICSLVYARVSDAELQRAPLFSRLMRGVWCACAISMVIFCAVIFGVKTYNPFILPGLFAILMGIGYYIHSNFDNQKLFRICAAGWWLSALVFLLEISLHSLAWLALAIVCFQIIPTAYLYFKAQKTYRFIISQQGVGNL